MQAQYKAVKTFLSGLELVEQEHLIDLLERAINAAEDHNYNLHNPTTV